MASELISFISFFISLRPLVPIRIRMGISEVQSLLPTLLTLIWISLLVLQKNGSNVVFQKGNISYPAIVGILA